MKGVLTLLGLLEKGGCNHTLLCTRPTTTTTITPKNWPCSSVDFCVTIAYSDPRPALFFFTNCNGDGNCLCFFRYFFTTPPMAGRRHSAPANSKLVMEVNLDRKTTSTTHACCPSVRGGRTAVVFQNLAWIIFKDYFWHIKGCMWWAEMRHYGSHNRSPILLFVRSTIFFCCYVVSKRLLTCCVDFVLMDWFAISLYKMD